MLRRLRCTDPADLPTAAAAWRDAADAGAALLISHGGADPDPEALAALESVLALDPMFGAAAARCLADGGVHLLRRHVGGTAADEAATLPRAALAELPETYIAVSAPAPCLLVRHELLAAFPALDTTMPTVAGAVELLLQRARRSGFRVVVANRAVAEAPVDSGRGGGWRPTAEDAAHIDKSIADAVKVRRMAARAAEHDLEAHLARARHPDRAVARSMVLDASALGTKLNGTSEAALALLDAVDRVAEGWTVAAVASPTARQAFGLDRRFRRIEVLSHPVSRGFSAGIRLSQPWTYTQMVSLHRIAWRTLFLMLDTIAWDTVYPSETDLGPIWRLLTETADGLVYISDYSRDRFVARFGDPAAFGGSGLVGRLPTSAGPYLPPATTSPIDGRFVFVSGGRASHKAMGPAVRAITAAFPDLPVLALGHRADPAIPTLTGLAGGDVPQTEIDAYYAHAAAVVFPSLYEGFGLPTLRGLAAGRTVIARDTPLLREIAGHYDGPGRLVGFRTEAEMVARLGAVLSGAEVPSLALGERRGDGTTNDDWDALARRLLTHAEGLIDRPESGLWRRREDRFASLVQYFEEIAARARSRAAEGSG